MYFSEIISTLESLTIVIVILLFLFRRTLFCPPPPIITCPTCAVCPVCPICQKSIGFLSTINSDYANNNFGSSQSLNKNYIMTVSNGYLTVDTVGQNANQSKLAVNPNGTTFSINEYGQLVILDSSNKIVNTFGIQNSLQNSYGFLSDYGKFIIISLSTGNILYS